MVQRGGEHNTFAQPGLGGLREDGEVQGGRLEGPTRPDGTGSRGGVVIAGEDEDGQVGVRGEEVVHAAYCSGIYLVVFKEVAGEEESIDL